MTRNVDAIWVPTKFVMDGLISSGVPAEKITVVPHGVDYELFAHTRDGTHRLDVCHLHNDARPIHLDAPCTILMCVCL